MKTVRLDKFLSDNTALSRSQIRVTVKRGNVSVNGAIIRDFGAKISPETDVIQLDNEVVSNKAFIYLILNKPKGVITASRDKLSQTIIDLIPDEFKHYDLFAVGRLDKDTTGLLLITNDGDFAHKVISPKSDVEKSYIAKVDGIAKENATEILLSGVTLSDGTVCRPAKLEFIGENTVRVIITEGKYHQVKRLLGYIGLGVVELHRERIGQLVLPQDLANGEIREIGQTMAFSVFS